MGYDKDIVGPGCFKHSALQKLGYTLKGSVFSGICLGEKNN